MYAQMRIRWDVALTTKRRTCFFAARAARSSRVTNPFFSLSSIDQMLASFSSVKNVAPSLRSRSAIWLGILREAGSDHLAALR